MCHALIVNFKKEITYRLLIIQSNFTLYKCPGHFFFKFAFLREIQRLKAGLASTNEVVNLIFAFLHFLLHCINLFQFQNFQQCLLLLLCGKHPCFICFKNIYFQITLLKEKVTCCHILSYMEIKVKEPLSLVDKLRYP